MAMLAADVLLMAYPVSMLELFRLVCAAAEVLAYGHNQAYETQ